ncbi:hypothetical protein B0H12DRAFT_1118660 [Mycena haematopus]|nr:hypothetical protein B0H12DRAFT_1118660 [Mycena haematopus]
MHTRRSSFDKKRSSDANHSPCFERTTNFITSLPFMIGQLVVELLDLSQGEGTSSRGRVPLHLVSGHRLIAYDICGTTSPIYTIRFLTLLELFEHWIPLPMKCNLDSGTFTGSLLGFVFRRDDLLELDHRLRSVSTVNLTVRKIMNPTEAELPSRMTCHGTGR